MESPKLMTPLEAHPFIRTVSGRRLELGNMRAEDIDLGDIAHHLSLINRFTGATDVPYPVALHCVSVANDLWHEWQDAHLALIGLLHDAPEYATNDVSSPMKKYLRRFTTCFDKLEHEIWNLVVERFKLAVTPTDLQRVKWADERAYFREHNLMIAQHGLMPVVNPVQVRDLFIEKFYEFGGEE